MAIPSVCATTQARLDDLLDDLGTVQTLAAVLHVALINDHLQPTLDDLQTFTRHLWHVAGDCTTRLEALLEGEGQP